MADGKPCAFQPIGWYERGVPELLKPSYGHSSEFYAYSITYSVLDKGWDDMSHSACEFLLLNPRRLDVEVANMSIALNLPGGADAVAKLFDRGTLVLHSEQVNLARRFKTWIFSFVLGKCLYQLNKAVEGYYILPLKISLEKISDINVSHLVDWNLIKSSINSDLMLKKGKNYDESYEKGDGKESVLIEAGFLILHNGSFSKLQLMDGIVTAAHDGMAYCIVSVLDEINIWSDLRDKDNGFPFNYMDYYRDKQHLHKKDGKGELASRAMHVTYWYQGQPVERGCPFAVSSSPFGESSFGIGAQGSYWYTHFLFQGIGSFDIRSL